MFLPDYPSECSSIDAPATFECMNAIWIEEGCILEGSHCPETLTGVDRTTLDSLSVL